jgi:multidrug resistance efflux pump
VWHSRASDSQSHTSHLTAGAPSAPLRAGRDGINPTFTWARLAQRIPVTVHLTHVPPGVVVSAGMTCTVVIKEGAGPEIGAGVKKLIAALF